MNWLNKLERKFGRYAVPNLIVYLIGAYSVGFVLNMVAPNILGFLNFQPYYILHGQIWRLITWILMPTDSNIIFLLIMMMFYYQLGTALERAWGTFRFNLFYFGGLLLVVIMTFIFYLFLQLGLVPNAATAYMDYMLSANIMDDLNQTMFLAFAFAFPDAQFLVYFIIPVKAKWLSIVYLLMDGYMFVRYLMSGYYYSAAVILVLLLNFFIFYFMGRGSLTPKQAYHQKKRKMEYKKKTAPKQGSVPMHHCVIFGRTDVDSPQLEFRYCSKCEGNYEYCSEHLFTHEHVHH